MTTIDLEIAQELALGCDCETYEFVEDVHLDDGRWESHHLIVFRDEDGKLLGFDHARGLTEYQESSDPIDSFGGYSPKDDTVQCYDVEPFHVVTYRRIQDA